MAVSRYSEDNPPPEAVEEIRARLAAICADWPKELFERVTARAAWIEFKYDRAMTDSFKPLSLRATTPARYANRPDRGEGSPATP